jgi:tripartite-type tricarboxylate transporter receptor subunit TctC
MARSGFSLLCTAVVSALTAALHAQTYPARAIRIIVPFPAGGTADLLPRVVAEKLAAHFGQPVVVDNRAGAAGNIGAEMVFNAESDGYTLLSAPPPPLVINPILYPKLAFDPTRFVPVSVMAAVPNVMLVHPKVPANNVRELIAWARAQPDRLLYSSQGSGTTSHLTTEMFKTAAGGLSATHVPYKGTAPALAALLAGEVNLMFDNLGVSLQHVRAGRVKALAVCGDKRVASLPDVPAMAETYPGFVAVAWFGVVAPPKTPAAISSRLSGELSAEPVGNTPAQMAEFMKEEAARWRAVVRSANVKLD